MPEQDVFAALADPTRRRILERLARGETPVHQLSEGFDISRPAVSRHLRVLRRAGLVRERRLGRENVYHLVPEALDSVAAWTRLISRYWAERLGALAALARKENEP